MSTSTKILILAALVIIGCLFLAANSTHNIDTAAASNTTSATVRASDYANMNSAECKILSTFCAKYNEMISTAAQADNTAKGVVDTTLDVGKSINGFIDYLTTGNQDGK